MAEVEPHEHIRPRDGQQLQDGSLSIPETQQVSPDKSFKLDDESYKFQSNTLGDTWWQVIKATL